MTDEAPPSPPEGKQARGISARLLALAGSPHASAVLAVVSFLESFILFLPTEALILPMVFARREHAWRIATIATLGSAAGALAGYGIGYFAYETLGRPLLEAYGHVDAFGQFKAYYSEYGHLVVLMGAITPFPFKLVTILSGFFQLSVPVLLAYCLLGRGIRFFLLVAVVWRFGPIARRWFERHLLWGMVGLTLLAIGVLVAVAYKL